MSRFRKICAIATSVVLSSGAMSMVHADKLGLGRDATATEIAGWNIGVRPDGHGMPAGRGSVARGEVIFQAQCASCHGEFGEGRDRWPALAGGVGSLTHDRPDKTVGSYWPHASTVFDYIRRAMPFGNAQSLSNDEVYAVTAYVLFLNDVIKDPSFELDAAALRDIRMPNRDGFYVDDREVTEQPFWQTTPCMRNCKTDAVVTSRARVLDVTPDAKTGPKVD